MEAIFGRPQILNALRSPPLAKVIKALFDKWTITVRFVFNSIHDVHYINNDLFIYVLVWIVVP